MMVKFNVEHPERSNALTYCGACKTTTEHRMLSVSAGKTPLDGPVWFHQAQCLRCCQVKHYTNQRDLEREYYYRHQPEDSAPLYANHWPYRVEPDPDADPADDFPF